MSPAQETDTLFQKLHDLGVLLLPKGCNWKESGAGLSQKIQKLASRSFVLREGEY
ncbi:MAG TPA: hypothetical protein VKR06_22320 [Ktedonosporobacter sp.]|nr:hypothetical protein [Ktedonosporobacter sp.]